MSFWSMHSRLCWCCHLQTRVFKKAVDCGLPLLTTPEHVGDNTIGVRKIILVKV